MSIDLDLIRCRHYLRLFFCSPYDVRALLCFGIFAKIYPTLDIILFLLSSLNNVHSFSKYHGYEEAYIMITYDIVIWGISLYTGRSRWRRSTSFSHSVFVVHETM